MVFKLFYSQIIKCMYFTLKLTCAVVQTDCNKFVGYYLQDYPIVSDKLVDEIIELCNPCIGELHEHDYRPK